MFVDKVDIKLKAGKGGDGIVSFRHEIYVDKGGPDGGDGGKGGDVIIIASRNENTLANYRYKKLWAAQDGKSGAGQNKRGKSGDNLILKVPVGTVVLHGDEIIADFTDDDVSQVIARGGDGGFGNAHFTSSVRQAPKVAEKGEPGDELDVTLELRMIADVGLVGLPNAGKSTFLSVVSNARPEIANYPFTTLKPNLGVVDLGKESSLLIADIPGLIEGASQGKGLGDDFLRHVSRCQLLLHLIDSTSDDIARDYQVIRRELKNYSLDLTKKPEIIVLSKVDLVDPEIIEYQKELLKAVAAKAEIFSLSAQAHIGLKELTGRAYQEVARQRIKETARRSQAEKPIITLQTSPDAWNLKKTATHWLVTGRKIEKFATRTDFSSEQGIARLRDIMKKMGILREITRQGVAVGDKIVIGKPKIGEIKF